MSVREIQAHLKSLYGVEISPDLISRVTDAVLDDIKAWQNRALDACYPVVIFDALRVKIRDEGFVRNKASILVERPLSSTKNRCCGSRSGWLSNHVSRPAFTSGRCCSEACAVFFYASGRAGRGTSTPPS
jgi:hypothetical protein